MIMPYVVVVAIQTVEDIGKTQYQSFMEECINDNVMLKPTN